MSIDIGSIIGGSLGELAKDLGSTVRSFITTDSDRLKLDLDSKALEIELEKIVNERVLKTTEQANEAVANYENEISERHKTDMASDSWLSKNVRPLSLIFFSVTLMVLVYTSTFIKLTVDQIVVLKQWALILSGLMTTMVMFYFGGRSIEKLKDVVAKVGKLKERIKVLIEENAKLKFRLAEYNRPPAPPLPPKKEIDEDWQELFGSD